MNNEKPTCGTLYGEAVNEYGTTPELARALACGFVSGQAEKVYLGACPAAMFRPSDDNYQWLLNEVIKIANRYGLVVSIIASGVFATPREIWITRNSKGLGRWMHCSVNSEAWHIWRAVACGIPLDEVDPDFHTRTGYGEICDGQHAVREGQQA
jgi:hypothetical protein